MRFRTVVAGLVAVVLSSCSGGDDVTFDTAASSPTITTGAATTRASEATSSPATGSTRPAIPGAIDVRVDAAQPGAEISPLILGFSSTLGPADLQSAGIRFDSWGGNPSTRYNYQIGHAWNHGSDFEFRNTNYGASGDSARQFLDANDAAGAATRLAVPTLGWVAKNDDESTCSFPDGAGGCRSAEDVGGCDADGPVADPTLANTPSTPEAVTEWVRSLLADGHDLTYIAMDNEPDIWGFTHYDVHPKCTTYEEIRDEYLTYASAIRPVAPDAKLAGPVICCWFDYWRIAPGPADSSQEREFVPWFLDAIHSYDTEHGTQLLDALDVHYYPQSNVFNDENDPETNARRLRSTRALWDPNYVDESFIGTPIRFIPHMRETIDAGYPGLDLLISEWNFGNDTTMNGAVTIADVLGIYGREGVDAAAYWRNPPVDSTGFFAFRMHGNYDGAGTRFGGLTVPAASDDMDLGTFAALDVAAGVLRVMLVNQDPDADKVAGLDVAGVGTGAEARRFTYSGADTTQIVADTVDATGGIDLPPYSITVVELSLS